MGFQEIEIYRSRSTLFIVLFFLTCIDAAFGWAAIWNYRKHSTNVYDLAVSLAMVAFLVPLILRYARLLLDTGPALEIRRAGIIIHAFSSDLIPWHGIQSITQRRLKMAGFVVVKIDPDVVAALRLKHRLLVAIGRKSLIEEARIPTLYLPYRSAALAEFLRTCLNLSISNRAEKPG